MKLFYDHFSPENIDDEIANILQSEEVILKFDNSQKGMLFLLGVLFAAGKKISLVNQDDVDKTRRSYFHAAYHWVTNGLHPSIPHSNLEDHIFLICPVTQATQEQISQMYEFIHKAEAEGYKVHYPARDTNQADHIGYQIATENSTANGNARHIAIFYSQKSVGSYFDLGVSYYFQYINPERTFTILNGDELIMNPADFGDKIVLQLLKKGKHLCMK